MASDKTSTHVQPNARGETRAKGALAGYRQVGLIMCSNAKLCPERVHRYHDNQEVVEHCKNEAT